MKKLTILLVLSLACSLPALAGKGNKGANANAGAGTDRKALRKVLRDVDTNKNHTIDTGEMESLKKAFAADPKGPLAKLDTNADAKLDDSEIGTFNDRAQKRAQKKANGGAKPGKTGKGKNK